MKGQSQPKVRQVKSSWRLQLMDPQQVQGQEFSEVRVGCPGERCDGRCRQGEAVDDDSSSQDDRKLVALLACSLRSSLTFAVEGGLHWIISSTVCSSSSARTMTRELDSRNCVLQAPLKNPLRKQMIALCTVHWRPLHMMQRSEYFPPRCRLAHHLSAVFIDAADRSKPVSG